MLGIPWARAYLGVDSYGIIAVGGSVIESEIIQKLLNANAGRNDGEIVVQIAPHDAVGCAIGIHGESGGGLFGYFHKGVIRKLVEAVAVLADGDTIQYSHRESLELWLVINCRCFISGSPTTSCYQQT